MITDKRVIANNYIGRLIFTILLIDYVPDWLYFMEYIEVYKN